MECEAVSRKWPKVSLWVGKALINKYLTRDTNNSISKDGAKYT